MRGINDGEYLERGMAMMSIAMSVVVANFHTKIRASAESQFPISQRTSSAVTTADTRVIQMTEFNTNW